jgi:hypothetical protein
MHPCKGSRTIFTTLLPSEEINSLQKSGIKEELKYIDSGGLQDEDCITFQKYFPFSKAII